MGDWNKCEIGILGGSLQAKQSKIWRNKIPWKWVMERLWKQNLWFTGKKTWNEHWKSCHWTSTSNREEKQEQIATYSCSIFILQRQDEYFKELLTIEKNKVFYLFCLLKTFLERQLQYARKNGKKFLLIGKKVWYHI